jgi:DNA-binding MarR family transcriptional regulator
MDVEAVAGSGADLLETYVPYKLYIAAAAVAHLIASTYAREFDLSLPEWRIVAALGARGELSQQAAADLVLLDKMTASRACTRLEANGLLIKRKDPVDARVLLIRFTPKGRRFYDRLVPFARDMERKLFGQFDEAQVAQLEQMLATVRQNATDLISQAEASTAVARPKRERRPIPHSG